jgi:hypothetical protein
MKLSPFHFSVLFFSVAIGLLAEESPKGVRLFTCAHSFHAFVYRQVAEAALDAGIKDHVSAGISSIGGSRVIQHWDLQDEKHQSKKALTEGKVDVLTLSPIWLPDEGIENFAKLGLEHNPNIRITVQQFWLPNDTYEPKYPLDTRKKVDHNATVLADLKQHQDRYDRDMDDYVKAINQKLGKDVIVTVPVGQAALILRQKIVDGLAPGLKTQQELFNDSWGHAAHPLQILSAYCHFAVIYQRSPVGLPLARDFIRLKKSKPEWDEKLNRLLQEIAWEAVTHHPLSGVKAAAH